MADPIDATIADIAATHGIVLGRDDPILVLHTMNERLLAQSVTAQQTLLDTYKSELEAAASRWNADAADRADRIVKEALTASRQALDGLLQDGAMASAASVRAEVEAALARAAASLHDARRLAFLTLAASCITLAAAGIVLWHSLA